MIMKFLLLVLLFSLSSFAQKKSTLEDQLIISQDVIDQFVQNLNARGNAQTDYPDYLDWRSKNQKVIESALIEYETTLRKKVFNPLSKVIERYYSTYENPNLSSRQKVTLLDSLLAQINTLTPGIGKNYKEQVRKLFYSDNMVPQSIKVDSKKIETVIEYYDRKGRRTNRERRNGKIVKKEIHDTKIFALYSDGVKGDINGLTGINKKLYIYKYNDNRRYTNYLEQGINDRSIRFYTFNNIWGIEIGEYCIEEKPCLNFLRLNNDLKNFNTDILFYSLQPYNFTHERIIKNCRSQVCTSLVASDLVFFKNMVSTVVAKNITVELPHPQKEIVKVTIYKPSLEIEADYYAKTLARTDYSEEYLALPYEI